MSKNEPDFYIDFEHSVTERQRLVLAKHFKFVTGEDVDVMLERVCEAMEEEPTRLIVIDSAPPIEDVERLGKRLRRHAWYSKEMAALPEYGRAVVYAREDGELVLATIVSGSREQPVGWDDTEYRGEVVRLVRRATGRETALGVIVGEHS